MKRNPLYVIAAVVIVLGVGYWMFAGSDRREAAPVNTAPNKTETTTVTKTETSSNPTVSKPAAKPTAATTKPAATTPTPKPVVAVVPYSIQFMYGYSDLYAVRDYLSFSVFAKEGPNIPAEDISGYTVSADMYKSNKTFVESAVTSYDRSTMSWKVYFKNPLELGDYSVTVGLNCRYGGSVQKTICGEKFGTGAKVAQTFEFKVQ